MTGANCFIVQSEPGGNGKYFSNQGRDDSVKNMIEEGPEVTRYDSCQAHTKTYVF